MRRGTRLGEHCLGRGWAALTLASQVSFTFWFFALGRASHPDGSKYPLNGKGEIPQKCSLFSFLLRTLFSSEDRVTGFGENSNYVTLVPRAA